MFFRGTCSTIHDIEPYSPVHSIHWDDDDENEQDIEDEIDILSNDANNIKEKLHLLTLKLPHKNIIWISILPVDFRIKKEIDKNLIIKINHEIEEICKENNFKYIDLFSRFEIEKNNGINFIDEDGVHLNDNGNQFLILAIKQALND